VPDLIARVLGSAAGGGFPQWNCTCAVCTLAWAGDQRVRPRTQAGIAASADGCNWLLCNASPDLRTQIMACSPLQPRTAPRHSPIKAVVLTGAEIDQIAGLLTLRERQAVALYATPTTLAAVAENPVFRALRPDSVTRHAVSVGQEVSPVPGLVMSLFTVPGKVALYLEGETTEIDEDAGNVGVELRSGECRLLYIPGAAAVTPTMRERMLAADVVLFDGTLFTDHEMITALGAGQKTGLRMGHMPIDGAAGSIAALRDIPARRIFIHINNTNPILIDGSPERKHAEESGFEVAFDGMEIAL
jgi:pyrroloquinoline quinone biosynthesis protein B